MEKELKFHGQRRLFSNGKFNWYGILRLFKRGHSIVIKPTLKCNLSCEYCGAEMAGGACWIEPGKELHWLEWVDIISDYEKKHGKVKQVGISGGEPFLYNHLSALMFHLSNEKRKLVYILSNMTAPSMWVPYSNRVKILATYHKGASAKRFKKCLNYCSERVFVVHQELPHTWPTIPGSMYRDEKFNGEINKLDFDMFGPDGTFYPKDKRENKEKYDKSRKEKQGITANPYRKTPR